MREMRKIRKTSTLTILTYLILFLTFLTLVTLSKIENPEFVNSFFNVVKNGSCYVLRKVFGNYIDEWSKIMALQIELKKSGN